MCWYVTLICTNYSKPFFTNGIVCSCSWFNEFMSVFLCPLGCQRHTYKAKVGNGPCLRCPSNSESSPQAVRCKCKNNFYRLRGNKHTDVCHGKELSTFSTFSNLIGTSACAADLLNPSYHKTLCTYVCQTPTLPSLNKYPT